MSVLWIFPYYKDNHGSGLAHCVIHNSKCSKYYHQGFPGGKLKVLAAQLCPTLCNSRDWSLPGASVHGILQARIPEWVAIPFSRRSLRPRDWTQISHIAGRLFTIWATSGLESALKCRGYRFDPWSGKISHASEQLSLCATTTEPTL